MADVAWPITLQQNLNASNFSYTIGETVTKSDSDIGPAKVRRRFTKSVDTMTASIWVTQAEWTILYNFYDVSLNGGVNPVLLTNPINGVVIRARFTAPPSFRPVSPLVYEASLNFEVLPS